MTLSSSPPLLYQRRHDEKRGRHLVASQKIPQGRLIFAERPLIALQSLANLRYATVCHNCKAFLGGPDYALHRRFNSSLIDNNNSSDEANPTNVDHGAINSKDFNRSNNANTEFDVVECRDECGHLFCSAACERDMWPVHSYLCTGRCDQNHPLVKFKEFATETNEILLLVAEWWVAQHVIVNSNTCASANDDGNKNIDSNTVQSTATLIATVMQSSPMKSATANPIYDDFVANPWWEVACADILSEPGGFAQAAELDKSLRQLCIDASKLLNQALQSNTFKSLPEITDLDIAKIVGACEQNAIGIRQRHPLCREIFSADLRNRQHANIVSALAEANFIGGENNTVENDNDNTDGNLAENSKDVDTVEITTTNVDNKSQGDQEKDSTNDSKEEWDYSVEEVADFLTTLNVGQETSYRLSNDNLVQSVNSSEGDDLDSIFPPLDGLAMYATACKMNHSCNPNVIIYYKRTLWGSKHPLVAYCTAVRDIGVDEELTISYIDTSLPFKERQAKLKNYGFTCECDRCKNDKSNTTTELLDNFSTNSKDDPFSSDGEDDDEDEINADTTNNEDYDNVKQDAEISLACILQDVKNLSNFSKICSIPLPIFATAMAYVLSTIQECVVAIDDKHVLRLLDRCKESLTNRNFEACINDGSELECVLITMLRNDGSWSNNSYRQAYWCSIVETAIGNAHNCFFINALEYLDKAMILGLSRNDKSISALVNYIEWHCYEMTRCPYNAIIGSIVTTSYNCNSDTSIAKNGIVDKVCEVEQAGDSITSNIKQDDPFVMREFAKSWPAINKWRNLSYFVCHYGHRLVPVERGSIMSKKVGMKEEIMSIRKLIEDHLVVCAGEWTLERALNDVHNVVYLAQHPLLDQIPSLEQDDLPINHEIFSKTLPSTQTSQKINVNVWIGTGGTRTPLHFDSYDNLFVQIVGCKYIRLYSQSETTKLYVSAKTSYGLQGNMSDVDCENEDWAKHPLAKDAIYTETILYPGDCLFIPSRTWHYVRSLSTSMSVNYWF